MGIMKDEKRLTEIIFILSKHSFSLHKEGCLNLIYFLKFWDGKEEWQEEKKNTFIALYTRCESWPNKQKKSFNQESFTKGFNNQHRVYAWWRD